ncbi:hypothetical protein ACEPAI_9680 [Sanghuangporus weigelae]
MPGIVISREDTPPVLLTSAQLKTLPTFADDLSFSSQRSSGSSFSSALSSPPPSTPQDRDLMDISSHRALPLGRAIPKDIPIARPTEENQSAFETSSSYVFRRAREGRKVIIGPMPVKAFLDDFLPPAPDVIPMPNSAAAFAEVSLNPVVEGDIYKPLASAINEGKWCPSTDFRITADGAGVRDRRSLEPSICGYSHQDILSLSQVPANGNEGCEPNLGGNKENFICETLLQRNTNNAEIPMEPGTGRVPEQCTRTNEYIEAPWVCECLRENLGSRELFDGARDALEALDSAFEQFDETGKAVDDLRCGTWAFMSARALRSRRDFRHIIEDDMESLFYVVMYGCLRWLPHNDVPRLGKWIRRFFDEAVEYGDGRDIGGLDKIINQAGRGSDFREAFQFPNEFVQAWFDIGYGYLATSHVLRRDSGSELLWTTRNLRQLFRTICNGLAAQEEAENDRMNHNMQGYLAAAEDHHGMHTSLLAGAIQFHAARAQEPVASKQVLDEAISGFDSPIDTRPEDRRQRSRKRRRRDSPAENAIVHYVGTKSQCPKSNRAIKKRKLNSVRSTQPDSAFDSSIASTYNLRSRRGRGCYSASDYGTRRSARLASKRSEPSSMATRRHQ